MTLFPTLTALLRTIDLGADARKALSRSQIKLIAGWRSRADNAVLSLRLFGRRPTSTPTLAAAA
jgi:hypothetical protein